MSRPSKVNFISILSTVPFKGKNPLLDCCTGIFTRAKRAYLSNHAKYAMIQPKGQKEREKEK